MFKFWISFLTWLGQVGSWLLVAVFLAAYIAAIAVIVWKIESRIPAIILTVLASILCITPLISSVNILAASTAKSIAVSEKKDEIETIKTKIENEELKKQAKEIEDKNENLNKTIENLNNELDLLKSAKLSVQALNKICELNLIETKYQQNDVLLKTLTSEKKAGVLADRVDTDVLIITTHDIIAKYGIDLKKVMIKEDSNKVLHISGINPKYNGNERMVSDTKINEIRQVEYKKTRDKQELQQTKVTVLNDIESVRRANDEARKHEAEFQDRLSKGTETSFLDSAVVKLAENFITVTLAPLNQEIVFDAYGSNGKSLQSFLTERCENKQKELNAVKNGDMKSK